MDAGQWKMRLPLLPTLLLTLSTIFLATSQRAFLSKYMSRSKLQRTEMSIFRQVNWIKFWYLYCNEKITTSFIRATFWQKQSRKVLIDPPWASLICLLGWGEHSKPMEISSPGVYNGRGSHHTRALPKFCLPEEGERLYRREGIAFLPMVVESLRGRAGEETRGCTRSAEWPSWQEEEEAPSLGTAWHPAEAGKCRNPGKPSSHSPCTLHLHATFEWTKLQLILNVPWLHCAQFNKYASINLLNHKLQFGLEQVGETDWTWLNILLFTTLLQILGELKRVNFVGGHEDDIWRAEEEDSSSNGGKGGGRKVKSRHIQDFCRALQ